MPFPVRDRSALSDFLSFGPVAATDRDDLVVPDGFRYQVVAAYGDRFTPANERFGFNCDFTAFIPRNAEATEGLLFVNHEYVGTATDYYGQAFSAAIGGVPTLEDMKFDVGTSVLDIYLSAGGNWLIKPAAG